MAKVVSHEKPGCGSNTPQKAPLVAAGHEVDAHELRTEPHTETALPSFFGDRAFFAIPRLY